MAPSRRGLRLRLLLLPLLLLSAGLWPGSFPAPIGHLNCPEGSFTDRNYSEHCNECSSCENSTILYKCNSTHDTVCGNETSAETMGPGIIAGVRNGSAENDPWSVTTIVLIVVVSVAVVAGAVLFYCKIKKGQVCMVGICNRRNSFEMQTAPEVVAVNGHSNPEANHNLLPGGNPDSADSVVLEMPLQSGHPNTPVPAQVTQEQDPEFTSVASSA